MAEVALDHQKWRACGPSSLKGEGQFVAKFRYLERIVRQHPLPKGTPPSGGAKEMVAELQETLEDYLKESSKPLGRTLFGTTWFTRFGKVKTFEMVCI